MREQLNLLLEMCLASPPPFYAAIEDEVAGLMARGESIEELKVDFSDIIKRAWESVLNSAQSLNGPAGKRVIAIILKRARLKSQLRQMIAGIDTTELDYSSVLEGEKL